MDTQLSVEHLSRRIRELEEQVDAKRWENELMRTDLERTKALVDHFPMATLILAGNGVLTGVNRRWESLWGGQSQEVVGAFNVLNDPQFRESGIAEGICRALGGEYVSLAGFELDPKRSGFPGQPHWACCHIFPLEEENGSSRQVVVIFEDITLCKQLEDNYSIVVDNTNEAIMVIQDGLIKFFNQKALSIAGYTNKEQYINQSFLQFLHPDYHDLVTGRHEQRVQGESVPNFYQIQVLHKDGRPIWLQLNAIKIDWEGRPASLAFMSDISDLKQTEEELRHNCEVQTIINSILTISQADISLEEFLQKSLEIVIGVPWLVFEARASISIVEEESDVLVMKAKNGLDPFYLKECRRVPFGRCLCGKAALSQVTEFADRMDDRHEVRGPRTFEHGHYCVPILFGGKTLGVFNVSVEKGHQRNAHYEAALAAIVNTLAGIFVH